MSCLYAPRSLRSSVVAIAIGEHRNTGGVDERPCAYPSRRRQEVLGRLHERASSSARSNVCSVASSALTRRTALPVLRVPLHRVLLERESLPARRRDAYGRRCLHATCPGIARQDRTGGDANKQRRAGAVRADNRGRAGDTKRSHRRQPRCRVCWIGLADRPIDRWRSPDRRTPAHAGLYTGRTGRIKQSGHVGMTTCSERASRIVEPSVHHRRTVGEEMPSPLLVDWTSGISSAAVTFCWSRKAPTVEADAAGVRRFRACNPPSGPGSQSPRDQADAHPQRVANPRPSTTKRLGANCRLSSKSS